MAVIAHAICPECEQQVIVFPAELYAALPADLEIQVATTAEMQAVYDTERRLRFAAADPLGVWRCPSCDFAARLPEGLGT